MAFERIAGPQGADRDDVHAALIASTIANVMGGGKKRLGLEDFIPRWDPQAEAERTDARMQEQIAMLRQATAQKKKPKK